MVSKKYYYDIDLRGNRLLNFAVESVSGELPSEAKEGAVIYHTGEGVMYQRLKDGWKVIASGKDLEDALSKVSEDLQALSKDTEEVLKTKQDKLVAGSHISIAADGKTISSTAQVNVIETVKVNNTALEVSGKAVNIDLSDYAKKGDVTTVMRYKGSVSTVSNLPTTDVTLGDTYNVIDTNANYTWDGSAWDLIGSTVDLSGYATKADVDSALDGKVSKSGDTMSGNLTIQKDSVRELTLKNTSISKSYNKWKQVGIINGNVSDGTIGQIEFLRNTPGGHLGSSIQLTAYNSTGGGKYIVLYSFDDGVKQEAYVQHPSWSVGTNDNSDKSLTIKMANSLPSLVHTTGAETIAGAKTFTTSIIDPQNQSGYIQTPNSSASSTPYYCVASRSISSMSTYDRSSFTFDIVAERYGDSIVYGTLQAMFETDSNKNIIASAIAMIYKSSVSSVATNVDNWFLTYNTTEDLIQVWCKLTSNQYVIRTRNRINASRYSEGTPWKLLNATKGQASAPSSDDGWVTVNCVDISNRLAESTPSNATAKEIATADWTIGKFVQKTGDTITGDLGVQGIVRMINGNLGAMARVGGNANGGKWYKVASLAPITDTYNDVHMMLAHFDDYAYGNNPTQRVGILNVHIRRAIESISGEIRFMTAGPNISVDNYALVTYSDYSAELYVRQQNGYSSPRFARIDANPSNKMVWTLYRENISVDSLDSLGGTITYATKPVILPPEFASENSNAPATTAWVNTASMVVHTTGSETVAGEKTFTSGIYHKGNNPVIHQNSILLKKGTKPSTSHISGLRYGDADGNILGGFRYLIRPNGNGEVYSEIVNFDGSATAMLKTIATADGKTYAEAPSIKKYVQDAETGEWKWVLDLNDDSNKIATTEWSTAKFVKKTGDTMTGNLGIKNAQPTLHLSLDDTGTYGNVNFNDKDGQRIGLLRGQISDGENRVVIAVGRPGTNTIDYLLTAINKGDFKPYVLTVTPSDKTDNTDRIATTAWVNQADFLVHTTGNETVAGIKSYTSPIVLNAWTGLHIKENSITKGSATQDRNINLHTGFYDKNDDGTNKTTNWLGGLRYTVPPHTTDAPPNTFVELSNQYYRDTYLRLYDNGTTAYATCPNPPSDATGNQIATATWTLGKFLKKSGDTMDGILYLTKDTTIYNEKDTNTIPTAYENRGSIYFRDKNNVNRAVIRCDADTQYTRTYFSAERFINGESKIARFDLRIQSDGRMVAYAPSPKVYDSSKNEWVLKPSENSAHIATCEWVNQTNFLVHSYGNETIGGVKSFSADPIVLKNTPSVILKDTKYALTDVFSEAYSYGWMQFMCKDGKDIGRLTVRGYSGGKRRIYQEIFGSDGTSSAHLSLWIGGNGIAYAEAPSPDTGESDKIATADWSIGKFVQKTGDTMTGTLSINNGILVIRKTTLESNNSATANVEVSRLQFRSASNETGNLISVSGPANNSTFLRATRKVGESIVDADIVAVIDKNGAKFGTAPTPTDKTDNSTKIATTAWVNQADFLVHSYGNESIAGVKTFKEHVYLVKASDGQFIIQTTNVTRGTTPSANTSVGRFRITDGANATFGEIYSSLGTDGSSTLTLAAIKNQTSRADAIIVLGWDANGKQYATAPPTQTNANSNEIATANWVNNKLAGKIHISANAPTASDGNDGDIWLQYE